MLNISLSSLVLEKENATRYFSNAELKQVTQKLPKRGLKAMLFSLKNLLRRETDNHQRAEFWNKYIKEFIEKIWTQDDNPTTQETFNEFYELCILTGDAFPSAYIFLEKYLEKTNITSMYSLSELEDKGLIEKFPNEVLDFLDIITKNASGDIYQLSLCLEQLKTADATLENDAKYIRLHNLALRHS